jgi:hypothetical protein
MYLDNKEHNVSEALWRSSGKNPRSSEESPKV